MANQGKPCFSFLLLGKTGNGKSATGNSILGERVFKSSASASSVTLEVCSATVEHNGSVLNIIDGPGTAETRLNDEETMIKATADMSKAMGLCPGGVNAMIIVNSFAARFTAEEQLSIDHLKFMLGPDVLKRYGVCVLTRGDEFCAEMEESVNPDMTPLEWVMASNSGYARLVEECGSRFVLFDNKAKDPTTRQNQVNELMRLVSSVPNTTQRYTNADFVAMQGERTKLIIKAKLPKIETEVRQRCSLLQVTLQGISVCNSDTPQRLSELKQKAAQVVNYINGEDRGTHVLTSLRSIVDSILVEISKSEVARNAHCQIKAKQELEIKRIETQRKEEEFQRHRERERAAAQEVENQIRRERERAAAQEEEFRRRREALAQQERDNANRRRRRRNDCVIA